MYVEGSFNATDYSFNSGTYGSLLGHEDVQMQCKDPLSETQIMLLCEANITLSCERQLPFHFYSYACVITNRPVGLCHVKVI